ncbi:hypothetical protein WJX81_008183 [Elliptochloris bilobata]|uniref:Rab3-GAP regulatory subunit N-terminal domain-containing protein n=1 Tax=Elliptochloris bilobata TaxID=381761 RepID=A0AAW1R1Q7_9CHLO
MHASNKRVAFAYRQQLALLFVDRADVVQPGAPAAVQAVQACGAGEAVTALCWVAWAPAPDSDAARQGPDDGCLLVGTSGGHLQLHAGASGALLHRQRLHGSACLALRPRVAGAGLCPEDAAEDVTAVFRDALARVSALEVRSLVRLCAQLGPTRDADWPPPLACPKWDLGRAVGPRADGQLVGVRGAGLYAALTQRASAPRLVLLTVGRDPAVAVNEAEEGAGRGTLALVGDLAHSAAASVATLTRDAVLGRPGGYRAGVRTWLRGSAERLAGERSATPSPPPEREREAPPPPPPPGEPAPLWRSVQDHPRAVTLLALAPRGPLAAAADALGRVMLLDAASSAVLRVLKGYRDAQLAWLLMPGLPAQRRRAGLPGFYANEEEEDPSRGSFMWNGRRQRPRKSRCPMRAAEAAEPAWYVEHAARIAEADEAEAIARGKSN